MVNHYTDNEMTKISRAEFNRGKTTRTQEVIELIKNKKILRVYSLWDFLDKLIIEIQALDKSEKEKI